MKKFLAFIIIVIGLFLVYHYVFKKEKTHEEKPKPLAVSRHSDAFNQSVNQILSDYYEMTKAFVNWDSGAVTTTASALKLSLEKLNIADLKKDSVIYETTIFPWENAKTNTSAISNSVDWAERRQALQDLSDNLRILLITVKYDHAIVYWQECPMAFGEGRHGNWLSNTEEIMNPYLGKKDPQYDATMVNCGETKSKIDFISHAN
jgi:hypothetical protein